MNKQRVIIDCDNTMGLPRWEVDDGLVILYLLGREDIELLGITNTFGNGSLADVVFYTRSLLKEIGREDIPRFSGEAYAAQNPHLIMDLRASNRYENEIPNQPFPSDAARFLVEQVDRYPSEISILALGPVGNLSDAARLDPDFFRKVKEIVIMGGYTEVLFIEGVPCRELNLSCNPEAAYRTFHAECPVILFNGHICLQAPFRSEDMRRIEYWPEERKRIIREWLDQVSSHYTSSGFYLWDLLPAVYLSYPELFDLKPVRIAPTIESLHRGMLQPMEEGQNRQRLEGDSVSIIMPENILDRTQFMDVLERAWRRSWKKESEGWG